MNFDLSQTSHKNGHIFGLPFEEENAKLILLPIPWDVTVSYREGTANGPQAILDASSQLDLYRNRYANTWQKGIYMYPIPEKATPLREKASTIIHSLEAGIPLSQKLLKDQQRINEESIRLAETIEQAVTELVQSGTDKAKLLV